MAEEEHKEERKGLRTRLAEVLVGGNAAVVPSEEHALMEAEVLDARVLRKDLDLLAWTALDYLGGSEQDMVAVERRKLVQRSRIAWQQDPQIGASTELMNDFALGRGVPRPKARDAKVQEVLDAAWEDPDNELILSSYAAQLALNTDLTIQCNLFVLVFEGDDGKVKLGMLDHDTVENVVRDPNNRRRHLYYVARPKMIKWDFRDDTAKPMTAEDREGKPRLLYYQHWENEPPDGMETPPADKIGKGKVYHVAINRTGEMAFGHPQMHRLLRWATAFNSLMESRVDMAKAAAAFVMKRKVKGTPHQVKKMAEGLLSRRSQLGIARPAPGESENELAGPRSASVLTENEGVDTESFKIDSGAQNANTDAQMIRSQISSASPGRWPQHYLGDVGSSNLATASAMELVPMKAVESRQEILEQLFRWFNDLVIEKAIEKGLIKKELTDAEMAEKEKAKEKEGTDEAKSQPTTEAPEDPTAPAGSNPQEAGAGAVAEAATDLGDDLEIGEDEEVGDDEDERMRDLSYDFSLPSPVRKMLSELITAIQTIAATFDPNNTNMELSRTLLAVAVGEGLEMADPGEVVEKVFPPGYKDPALAALGGGGLPPGAAPRAQPEPGQPGAAPAPGEGPGEGENPYGANQGSSLTNGNGNPFGGLAEALVEGLGDALNAKARDGRTLEESLIERLSPDARKRLKERMDQTDSEFDAAAAPVRELTGGS